MKGADWSQHVYIIPHNGVFIYKMQFNLIKLYVYVSDIDYLNKVITDHW